LTGLKEKSDKNKPAAGPSIAELFAVNVEAIDE